MTKHSNRKAKAAFAPMQRVFVKGNKYTGSLFGTVQWARGSKIGVWLDRCSREQTFDAKELTAA